MFSMRRTARERTRDLLETVRRRPLYYTARRRIPGLGWVADKLWAIAFGPVQMDAIERDAQLCFRCDLDVPCLNVCCTGARLALTPYDVLRLRRQLALSSEDFFASHARVEEIPGHSLPLVVLKMREEIGGLCPFAGAQGCQVYTDRPGVCRAYPIGRASYLDQEGLLREQHVIHRDTCCHGHGREQTLTVAGYLEDQGFTPYIEFADRHAALISLLRARQVELSAAQKESAITALYRLDDFAALIEERGLLLHHRVKTARRRKIRTDEEERLRFAFEWLHTALFGQITSLGKLLDDLK